MKEEKQETLVKRRNVVKLCPNCNSVLVPRIVGECISLRCKITEEKLDDYHTNLSKFKSRDCIWVCKKGCVVAL
jgi:predicted metal-binding protein